MGDVDESPLEPRRYRELPYDREVRARRRGRGASWIVTGVLVAIAALMYWVRHR